MRRPAGGAWARPRAAPRLPDWRALAPAFAGDSGAVQKLLEFDHPEVALALITRWRERVDHGLVILDQFEELFTINGEDVRRRFAELLGKIAALDGLHVLLSMRDDFLFQCSAYPPLSGVFSAVTPLPPLTRAALAQALVRPAERFGFAFEDGLVEEMVQSVEGERGALPLLAFVVARLWEERDREKKRLTREGYERVGGVAGALAHHAEATLERIGTERASIVREFFRNLVTAEQTRCEAEVEELLSAFPEDRRDEVRHVLEELIDSRLLTRFEVEAPDGSRQARVEVVHESLFQRWPRLARWIAQDADGALLRDQLKQAAHLWGEKGKPKDLLWTGSPFREYEFWRERYPGALTQLEEEFGQSMTARARGRMRLGRAAMVAGLVLLAAIGLVIGVSWQRAVRSAHLAEAGKLLALAELRLSDDPTEALAFATASLQEADTKQARAFVMKTLWDSPPARELIGSASGVRVPAFSPDGKWLAAGGHTSEVWVWGQDGRSPLVLPGHDVSNEGTIVAQWASNDLLVTGLRSYLAKRVHVWSIPYGRLLRTIDVGRIGDWQVGPRRLLVPTWQGDSGNWLVLRSWSLPNGKAKDLDVVNWKRNWSGFAPSGNAWLYLLGRDVYEHPLPAGAGPDRLFARLGADLAWVDPYGGRLVFADRAGEIQVWLYRPGQAPERRVVRQESPALTPLDGSESWMYDLLPEQKVRVRSVGAWPGSRPLDLRRNASGYLSWAAVHPAGEWAVASTSTLSRLTFWPLRHAAPMIVDGYRGGTRRPVAFSPDGRWLATSWADGRLRLWPLPGSGASDVRVLSLPPEQGSMAMTFDRASRFLFAQHGPHAVDVAPLDGGPPRQLHDPSPASDAAITALAVSPSGRLVAGASIPSQAGTCVCTRTLRIWNLETGEVKRFVPPAAHDAVDSLAFADESTLYSVGIGGLWRWDPEKGTHETAISAPGAYFRASFSKDARQALIFQTAPGSFECQRVLIHDTRSRTSRPLTAFGECYAAGGIDNSGQVAAVAAPDGSVLVGRLTGDAPHLLGTHKGRVDSVAISPDLRWVATTGEDNTLRLWPMPDLSKPPLHTLPHDALLAKLKSLTNFRATRDPSSPDGWKIEIGPFPGWATVPEW